MYNVGEQTVDVRKDVKFDASGVVNGKITHAAQGSQVVIEEAGDFYVGVSACAAGPYQMALMLNSRMAVTLGSGPGVQQTSAQVIVRIREDDLPSKLSLRNYASLGPVLLRTFAGGSEKNITASLTIVKL